MRFRSSAQRKAVMRKYRVGKSDNIMGFDGYFLKKEGARIPSVIAIPTKKMAHGWAKKLNSGKYRLKHQLNPLASDVRSKLVRIRR